MTTKKKAQPTKEDIVAGFTGGSSLAQPEAPQPKTPVCDVCGERPFTHLGEDKQKLCDECGSKGRLTKKPGMRIVAMQVENIKRVRFARITPKGSMVVITGPNESGKSSLLDAIEWAITGTSTIPSQPITKGKPTARIVLDIGDFKVVREFTRVNGGKDPWITKLRIFGTKGEQFPTPQKLLDSFMGAISFDPLEFTRMEPKKQVDTLRGLVTFDVDIDALDAEKAEAYNGRRDARRDLDSAEARLKATPAPAEGLPDEPIDGDALTRKLQEAANHNSVVAAQKQAQAKMREDADAELQKVYDLQAEVEQLKARIDQANKEAEAANHESSRLQLEAGNMKIEAETDTAEVAAELTQAQTTNAALQRRETYRSVAVQVTEAQARWDAFDATVKAKEAERTSAIERAKMPIEKLGIGDGEVLYDELPFSQASNAMQIRVSVALAIASNPTLRIMRIKDGSLLDQKSVGLIETMAEESNTQIWMERVEGAGKVSVVMEDGEASGDEVEPEPKR
jgi:energy-coupling factor transporter ATP-binding protein EcfA2